MLDGIRRVSDALKEGKLRISPACRDTIREFGLYRWDIRAAKDAPRKEHDHAMDDIRYFVTTILCREEEGLLCACYRAAVSPSIKKGGSK